MPGTEDGYRLEPEECDHCNGYWDTHDGNYGADSWHDCCECGLRATSGGSDGGYAIGYDPPLDFHGEGPVYLGFELELEGPRDFNPGMQIMRERLGSLIYLHHDGSLRNGLEIVTHPMQYEWAIGNFDWSTLPALREAGWRAADTCGLHVHVSREGFDGPAHIHKWLKLIYRNAEAMQAIARRMDSRWASFSDRSRRDHLKYAKGDHNADRYQAVNVQNNATFEVRMFASSLNPQQVQAAIGLVDASVEYARQLSAHDIAQSNGWAWPNFTQWVRDQGDLYRPLRGQIWRRARSAMPANTIPRRDLSVRDWADRSVLCAWCAQSGYDHVGHDYWSCTMRSPRYGPLRCGYCGQEGHARTQCALRWEHQHPETPEQHYPEMVRAVLRADRERAAEQARRAAEPPSPLRPDEYVAFYLNAATTTVPANLRTPTTTTTASSWESRLVDEPPF
jgi:Putative amidoligase enzyme